MQNRAKVDRSAKPKQALRVDPPQIDPGSLWAAMTQTSGVGVSITDGEGRLLFVNDTAKVLFSEDVNVDYHGRHISDFHSPEFCAERLAMIDRVLREQKPFAVSHIYHGKRIRSTVWPIRDVQPPFNRVLVISLESRGHNDDSIPEAELIKSAYIDLGNLDVLTRRELEVAVLLGHGMSVPRVAKLLHRSPKTIERHKASVTKKLKLHGQSELVAVITEMGLDLDDTKLKRLPHNYKT